VLRLSAAVSLAGHYSRIKPASGAVPGRINALSAQGLRIPRFVE
jgi:hypothetical protein